MGDNSRAERGNWIQITVRLKVPPGMSGVEVLRLAEGWSSRLQSHLKLDLDSSPVPVVARGVVPGEAQLFVIRAWIDPRYMDVLRDETWVDHVARDARLEPFAGTPMVQGVGAAPRRVDCGTRDKADGTVDDVIRDLGVARIRAAGYTGRGIVVGVVDGGITAHGRPTRVGGWPAIPQAPAVGEVIAGWPVADWGTTAEGWGQHGNMIAFDVQAMAPEAQLWDIRVWEAQAKFEGYVFNAVAGYGQAIDHYRKHGVPQILVNCWGLYDSDNGPDYAFNPRSDMALVVEQAIDAGMLVLFAAGNCGGGCPFPGGTLCGFASRGPGASILGPNGHPEVMTVGAATLRGEWCGYTSQGPAALPPNDPDKPDFCSISQFEGFFPNDSGLRPYDGGTSAATGIAAGVVALLKQARPDLTQEECKRLLRETARPIRTPAAHDGAGTGVMDALRAFRSL